MIDTFENIKKRKINNKTIIIIKKILKEDKKKINIDELVERFKLLNISSKRKFNILNLNNFLLTLKNF
jgi:hypothetical protein